MTRQAKRVMFAVTCVAAISGSALYMARGRPSPAATAVPGDRRLDRMEPGRAGILFVDMTPGTGFGKVAFVPLDAIDGPRYVSPLRCDRVYYQAGRGVCLTIEDTLLPPYAWTTFDASFNTAGKQPLTGVPSRTRLSPDGRRAAITVFESGHSYAEDGFSTRTTLIDTPANTTMADLETFSVWRDGKAFHAVDFNFWGVTFARDGNRFFATLRTGGSNYLVEGHVDDRRVRIIATGVECPSISPDNRRLAFKKRASGRTLGDWRVAVLELDTMTETVLDSEQRSVDDQVEWFDDTHVLYHQTGADGASVWVLRTDAPEPPRLLLRSAYSPAVVR